MSPLLFATLPWGGWRPPSEATEDQLPYGNGFGYSALYATFNTKSRRTRGTASYASASPHAKIGILPMLDATVGSCMSKEFANWLQKPRQWEKAKEI